MNNPSKSNVESIINELININEMPEVGKFKHEGITYHLQIYYEEGTEGYPHFHLYVEGQPYKTDMCIRLDVPEYFEHGNHKGRFNSRGRKKLNNYLQLTDEASGRTKWQA